MLNNPNYNYPCYSNEKNINLNYCSEDFYMNKYNYNTDLTNKTQSSKKPSSAWILFLTSVRNNLMKNIDCDYNSIYFNEKVSELKKNFEPISKNNKEIFSQIANIWKEASQEDKMFYTLKAKEGQDDYYKNKNEIENINKLTNINNYNKPNFTMSHIPEYNTKNIYFENDEINSNDKRKIKRLKLRNNSSLKRPKSPYMLFYLDFFNNNITLEKMNNNSFIFDRVSVLYRKFKEKIFLLPETNSRLGSIWKGIKIEDKKYYINVSKNQVKYLDETYEKGVTSKKSKKNYKNQFLFDNNDSNIISRDHSYESHKNNFNNRVNITGSPHSIATITDENNEGAEENDEDYRPNINAVYKPSENTCSKIIKILSIRDESQSNKKTFEILANNMEFSLIIQLKNPDILTDIHENQLSFTLSLYPFIEKFTADYNFKQLSNFDLFRIYDIIQEIFNNFAGLLEKSQVQIQFNKARNCYKIKIESQTMLKNLTCELILNGEQDKDKLMDKIVDYRNILYEMHLETLRLDTLLKEKNNKIHLLQKKSRKNN